ncbi:hypothetical protein ACFXKS_21390 [Streptomyces scopuliridis]|uniref:hypothetical protein n=1 Tax=Streptomyces scopuliridis TaxID=452529 RepID=UPI0036745740
MSSAPSGVRAGSGRTLRLLRGAARLLAAAGLAWDAYLHAYLAPQYDVVTASISQGDLFRIEAGLASLAALLVLVWQRLPGDLFAWSVAAGGLALLLIYRYVDVGQLGPIPDMYEPIWYGDKKLAVLAEAIAVVATVFLLITHPWAVRRRGRRRAGRRARRT